MTHVWYLMYIINQNTLSMPPVFVAFLVVMLDMIEFILSILVKWVVSFLPVKIIRDDNGKPFLYRYNLLMCSANGPGVCIHRFVASDPDRGFHDHPWNGFSFILSGRYTERVLNLHDNNGNDVKTKIHNMDNYDEYQRNRFRFNCFKGKDKFHRVMIRPYEEAWTIFFSTTRAKTWGMIGLDGKYRSMSVQVKDTDGGWWKEPNVKTGYELENRIPHSGVSMTVDIAVVQDDSILLIKRGKDPYKDYWALPGGRVEKSDGSLVTAALRELKEETNLDLQKDNLQFVTLVGNNKRDPRGFCTSCLYLAQFDEPIPQKIRAGDDAVEYKWATFEDILKDDTELLAFDHRELIGKVQHTMTK